MPVETLVDFLESNKVTYERISHSQTYTAQRTAQAVHISGREMAKNVIVKLDGRMCMVVIPAPFHVEFEKLKTATGAKHVELADESEIRNSFPNCEVGAMPPFGNLYEMDVYIQQELAQDEEIAFNAGTHTEVFRLAYQDFAKLVDPVVGDYSGP